MTLQTMVGTNRAESLGLTKVLPEMFTISKVAKDEGIDEYKCDNGGDGDELEDFDKDIEDISG